MMCISVLKVAPSTIFTHTIVYNNKTIYIYIYIYIYSNPGATHWNIEEKYAMAYIKRMQQFVKYCNKMNRRDDGSSKLYNTSKNNIDRQQRRRRRRRRRSLSSRAHSDKSRVDYIATASLGDGGVEAFLVHERRRQRPNHPTISPTSSSSSSHNSRRGILVMRGSVNDD
jgi:hypothetical protein